MEIDILKLNRDTATGVVKYAIVKFSVSDELNTASKVLEISFSKKDPFTVDFIPYQNLTKEIVVDWIMNDLELDDLRKALKKELSIKSNPTHEIGLPWS